MAVMMAVMTADDRRDYRSGSVYQRKDGRWVASVEAGWTARGTRRRVSRTADTEARAKVKLRELVRDLERGTTSLDPRKTVKAWVDDWLTIAERTMRPQSYTNSASACRKWIVPTIGHERLSELAPAAVRAVDAAQRKAGLVETSRRRTHSTLMALLKAAQGEGYVVPPNVFNVPAPKKNTSDRIGPSVEQALAVLAIAAEQPDGAKWAAAFLQGLRQAERLGLTVGPDGLDLERGTLTVSWQLQPLPYKVKRDRSSGFRVPDGFEAKQIRGRLHLVRPKTDSGWRTMPLLPWMHAAFTAWLEASPPGAHGLVWPVPVGDPAKLDDKAWYALQDAAGVRHPSGRRYTIHEARHATATLLLEAGVDPAVITAILGHSTIVTSRGYMHPTMAPLEDALSKVAERLALTPPALPAAPEARGR